MSDSVQTACALKYRLFSCMMLLDSDDKQTLAFKSEINFRVTLLLSGDLALPGFRSDLGRHPTERLRSVAIGHFRHGPAQPNPKRHISEALRTYTSGPPNVGKWPRCSRWIGAPVGRAPPLSGVDSRVTKGWYGARSTVEVIQSAGGVDQDQSCSLIESPRVSRRPFGLSQAMTA